MGATSWAGREIVSRFVPQYGGRKLVRAVWVSSSGWTIGAVLYVGSVRRSRHTSTAAPKAARLPKRRWSSAAA
jgi:hypothetical protein